MRESFGGAFMLKLALIFIIIYVSFMAIAIRYAKTFRIKNYVINLVEQYQYSGSEDNDALTKISNSLDGKGVDIASSAVKSDCEKSQKETGGDSVIVGNYAVCIASRGTADNKYYKVVTYVSLEFPFFQLYWTFPISGETNIIK